MTDGRRSADELLGLVGDDLTRQLLLATSESPLSAEELSERLGVSRTTVYRRVKRLGRYDLLHEAIRTDDDGHHYRVFETAVTELSFGIVDGEFTITVSVDESLIDQFEGFMSGLETSVRHVTNETAEQADRTDPWEDPHHG